MTPWRPSTATCPGRPPSPEAWGALTAPRAAAKPQWGRFAPRARAARGLPVKDAGDRLRLLSVLLQACRAVSRLPETTQDPPSPAANRGLRPRRATTAWARARARARTRTPPRPAAPAGARRGRTGSRRPRPQRGRGKAARVSVAPRQPLRSLRQHTDPSAGARSRHLPLRRYSSTSTPARPAARSPSASHMVRSCPARHAGI